MSTATTWIVRRPHRNGVEACIRDTNINVWGLIHRRREGWTDARIMESIQGLSIEDLQGAWEYAAAHGAEIDEAIRRNAEG
jgi:uncharacterized protein (DUF433 family)